MSMLPFLYEHGHACIVGHPWASLAGLLAVVHYITARRGPDLPHIPSVGPNGILSYWEGLRFGLCAKQMIQDGYNKFQGSVFKIPMPNQWQVIIASLDMVDELRLADEADLSLDQAFAEAIQSSYTIGNNIIQNPYHVHSLRASLNRNLRVKFDDIYDEIVQSCEDLIPANDKEWLTISVASTLLDVVCRTSNRLFVGLPLCRNPEWIELNNTFTVDAFFKGSIIGLVPTFLKPIVGRLLSHYDRAMRIGKKYLEEDVKQRIEMDDRYGKSYDGRPNDMVSWLLEDAQGKERTADRIIQRIVVINMAAIHTSSNSIMLALLNLAAYPEYILPLRQEITEVVEKYGWTKTAISKMRKVDSFLKESSRFESINSLAVNRKVTNPAGYTFKDGLHLPYGTYIGIATHAIHHDAEYYDNPMTFDGFRYSRMRDDDGEGTNNQMVSTRLHYLNFGHGRHACPGRFFAASELKTILAHLVLTYDIALEGDVKPMSKAFGISVVPNNEAKLLFKRLPN